MTLVPVSLGVFNLQRLKTISGNWLCANEVVPTLDSNYWKAIV